MRLIAGILAVLGLFVVFGWVVPATFGPLVVNCNAMDPPACTETWQTAAAYAVSEGLANSGVPVLFVTVHATPVPGAAWCGSSVDVYWSDGTHLSQQGLC